MTFAQIKKLLSTDRKCCDCKWTTEGRPQNPTESMRGYNKTLHQFEYWNGSAWTQY